ncbi:MAG: flagellar hook protein FlgE [Alphaproteobacteria bacterium]|nr:MAG: flagellar hook protein FlgE [Alphaproteobacteria bacterium]
MSVFGSLFTAVSGLSAQAQSMGMISNNIANIATVGYKRTDAAFSSLVTSSSRSTLYAPGSVKATQNQRIDLQGILQQSASATDLAISGNGFFIVKASTTDPNAEILYTRAGSFSEDQNGNLTNTSGFNLFGWPLDQSGNIIGSTTSTSALVPVNVAFPTGLTQPTTEMALTANLDANQIVNASPTPDFSRDITVYDSLGNGHTISINFKKQASSLPTATGTFDLSLVNGNFQPGTDSFDVDGGLGPTTITLDGDVNKLLTDLNAAPGVLAHIDGNNFLVIQSSDTAITATLTLAENSGTPLASQLGITPGGFAAVDYTTNLLSGAVPQNTPEPSEGWWYVSFDAQGIGTNSEEGYISFNSDGTLNAVPDANGDVFSQLGTINWGNSSNPQTIQFNLADLVQHAGDYTVSSADQNGTALGFRTGVSVNDDGVVSCQFSNGLSREVYRLAIGTFADTNGLTPLTGNVFRASDTSGTVVLNQANNQGAGSVQGGALEQANVDLADEFSKMIITQRAYSANTKVISTADQMTQDLLNIR